MNDKDTLFLSTADFLAAHFDFVPLLYGSLGLQKRLHTDLGAEDIDILIPERYLLSEWSAFKASLESQGYQLYDLHEHAFLKESVSVAFAGIESLWDFAGICISAIPIVTEGTHRYRLLTLKDYLKVYQASSKDSYRADKNNQKDALKIKLIQTKLGLS